MFDRLPGHEDTFLSDYIFICCIQIVVINYFFTILIGIKVDILKLLLELVAGNAHAEKPARQHVCLKVQRNKISTRVDKHLKWIL